MELNRKKKYVIGADNAGYPLKEKLKIYLKEWNLQFEDVGVYNELDETIYPKIAKKVVDKIENSNYEKEGIIICGTGIGMAITANKFKDIHAAVCHDVYSAERARLSNDTNVITMGARLMGPVLAKRLLKKWLSLEFKPGRSTPKLKQIYEYENENFKSRQR